MEMHALHNWSDGDTFYVNHIVSTSLSMCDIFNVFTVCFRSLLFIRHKLIIRMVFVCLFDHSFASTEIRLKYNDYKNELMWTAKWPNLFTLNEAMALYLGRSKTHDFNKGNK